MRRFRCTRSVTIALTVVSCAVGSSVRAADEAVTLQEITVTAQRRVQNLQDVGTSITAFDAKELANLKLTDATDLVAHVPGLQFNWFGPSLLVYNLRGVSQNDYSDHQEAPVAVYSDEAYEGAMGALAGSLFDLERVEVLRGPQGTLFGRNATGGLIQYISRAPTAEPEAYIQTTGGHYVSGSNAYTVATEGAIGGPLTDSLSARLSFGTDYNDGLIENRIGPNVEDTNQYAARLQFLLKPSDTTELWLKLYETRNIHEIPGDYSWAAAVSGEGGLGRVIGPTENPWGTCPGCDLDGYRNPSTNKFNQAISDPGYFDRTVIGATGRLKWKLAPSVTLTSLTDYQKMSKDYYEHSNPSPISPIFFGTSQRYRQISEELRLNGELTGLRWIAGAYYLDRRSNDSALSVFGGTFTVLPGENAQNRYVLTTQSASAFGQVEWDIVSDLTVSAGIRYTHDKIKDDYTLYDLPEDSAPIPSLVFNPTTDPDLAERSFNLLSGKVELDYKKFRDLLLYASVSRGVKGGGYSTPSFNTSVFGSPPLTKDRLVFDPEVLMSYEVGEKWTFFGHRARLNAAAFYYDYRHYQGLTSVNFLNTVGNYPAEIFGGELELELAPAKGLTLQVGVSALNATVRGIAEPAGGFFAERNMPQAPKWSVTGLARYEWPVGNGQVYTQTDWKFDDDLYFTVLNNPSDFEPRHIVGNGQFGFKTDSWDVALSVRNLANRLYKVYNSDASGFGFVQPVYAPSRWVGVTASYHWN
jgi:iron complex outermembrane recepter protein